MVAIVVLAVMAGWVYLLIPLPVGVKKPVAPTPGSEPAEEEWDPLKREPALFEYSIVFLPRKGHLVWQEATRRTPCSPGARCFTPAGMPFGVQLDAQNRVVALTPPDQGEVWWVRFRQPVSLQAGLGRAVRFFAQGWGRGFLLRVGPGGKIQFVPSRFEPGRGPTP